MLQLYFLLDGYEVIAATGGEESLQKLAGKPDIILLYINMPDIDGLSLCKNIRDFVSCPILLLTANIEDSDKIKGFSVGGDDYIVKPFSIDELDIEIKKQFVQTVDFVMQLKDTAKLYAATSSLHFPMKLRRKRFIYARKLCCKSLKIFYQMQYALPEVRFI